MKNTTPNRFLPVKKNPKTMKINTYLTSLATLPLTALACATTPDREPLAPGAQPEPPAPAARPNIVFAFGDDYGRYASIYGEVEQDAICRLIKTPNIDRIAREGVLFTNAHVPAPSSTPCRSSVLSGQYFWRTGKGAILFGAEWDTSIPSYPLLLEENGYFIGFTYKAWAPGIVLNAPYGGNRNQYRGHGNKFNSFSEEVTAAGPANYEKRKQELYDEVAENFRDFLDANSGDKPFCYWWGPTNTHRDWAQGSGRALWGLNPDDLQGKLPAGLADVGVVREDFCDYLGECQAFDAGLGIILRILEERGELDNTIVVVSGDHGIPGFPRAKCNLYDLGTRVTLAVRYPPSVPGNRVVSDFVNLMDLAPTFLEFGQTSVPAVMTGQSIKGILEQQASGQVDPARTYVVTGRERHVHDAREGNLPYPQRAIVTDRYKYIRNFKPDRLPIGRIGTGTQDLKDIDAGPTKRWYKSVLYDPAYKYYVDLAFGLRPYEELYDLKADPGEVSNLAGDPAYGKILKELSARLDNVLTTYGDPRMEAGECIYDTDEFTSLLPPPSYINKGKKRE